MITALLLSWPAAAAPSTPLARDWSYLETRLDSCPIHWDDLIHAHVKSGHYGADPALSEYGIGWVYPAISPQVAVSLYDYPTDSVEGGAIADDTGAVSVWGDVTDIEPVMLARDCQAPIRPLYLIRIVTVDTPNGFLDLVY